MKFNSLILSIVPLVNNSISEQGSFDLNGSGYSLLEFFYYCLSLIFLFSVCLYESF